MAERLGWRRWSLWNVQHCSRSPPSHPLPPSLFPAHLPPLSFLRQPPFCLTLSHLRASICLQSFPPSPLTPPSSPTFLPDFPSFPVFSPVAPSSPPSLTGAVTGAVINHQSWALSGTSEPRGATLPSPPLSFICLSLLPLTNLFQLISPPKWPPLPN